MFIQSGVWAIFSRYSELFKSFFVVKSLKFRIFILLMLVGIFPMFVLSAAMLAHYEANAVNVTKNEALSNFRILADYLDSSGFIYDSSINTVNHEVIQMSNLYDGRILVINSDYRVIKDTYGISEAKTIISEEVIKCLGGEQISNYDSVNNYIELVVPIVSSVDGKVEGSILASVSTATIEDTLSSMRRVAIILQVIIDLLIFACAVVLSRLVVRPFNHVTQAISSMEAGYDRKPIDVNGYREMESIMGALNQLLDRMGTLDESRQEFVSNVSHELKTPLASMKILADSLIMQPDAPVEMYREFMEDITQEIDRENDIISDLLSLVKMDKKEGTLNIKLVNINELLDMILKRLKPLAEQNNIELIFESERTVEAEIDEVKLTLAFSNLIENGIKYNRKDGWVKVNLNADHKFMLLEVSDSGIGIPEQYIDSIFERFYRVDKSHSREIGGSGLGLAITRSAILMHRGAIKASSVEGEGTTFTVRIPLTYV